MILLLGIVGAVGLMAALIGYLARAVQRDRERRRALVQGALTSRDQAVVVSAETGRAALTVRGRDVRFSFVTRGAGSTSEAWTEVEVDVPHEPLVLGVRRQSEREEKLVTEGLAVDVEIGDEAIDRKYVIEGAPAAVVRRLFTEAVRTLLGAVDPDEVETKPFGLVVARRGWKEEQASIQAFVDLAVELAESVGPAFAETAKAEAPQPTSAYRGEQASAEDKERWQAARREAEERQAAEVAGLEATRKRRQAELMSRMVLGVAVVLAVAALLASVLHMLG